MVRKISLDAIEKVQAQQDRLRERYTQKNDHPYEGEEGEHSSAPQVGDAAYWYFFCLVPKAGRLDYRGLGPFLSEEEAEKAAEKAGAESPVFRNYPTKNRNRAQNMFVAELMLEDGMENAPTRFGHEKTLARDEAKRKKRFGII